MHAQICLVARTVCGCSFDVVDRGGDPRAGGPPRLWRRLSSPILSSLEKKESGPRRAVDCLSGRYWLGEILKFCFEPGVVEYYLQLCFCVAAIPQSASLTAPFALHGFDLANRAALRCACALGVSPTCRRKKRIGIYLRHARRKLCEAFLLA